MLIDPTTLDGATCRSVVVYTPSQEREREEEAIDVNWWEAPPFTEARKERRARSDDVPFPPPYPSAIDEGEGIPLLSGPKIPSRFKVEDWLTIVACRKFPQSKGFPPLVVRTYDTAATAAKKGRAEIYRVSSPRTEEMCGAICYIRSLPVGVTYDPRAIDGGYRRCALHIVTMPPLEWCIGRWW